jgi:hypothetical protein
MQAIIRYAIAASILSGVACKVAPQSASDAKIFGGTETNGHPAILRMLVDKSRGRFCTGIAVSESTVLMAGHCIKSETLAADGGLYAELMTNTKPGVTAEQMRNAKKYVAMWSAVGNLELLTDEAAGKDLAVVWFDNAPFQNHVRIASSALAGSSAAVGTRITLVGFGAKEFGNSIGALNSAGVKRVGTNAIAAARKGLYLVKADLRATAAQEGNAAQAAGDAGGPIFDGNGELIGIGAGVRLLKADGSATGTAEGPWKYLLPNPTGAAYAENSFVSLASEDALNLLRYAVQKGARIDGVEGKVPPSFKPDDEIWAAPNGADKRGVWVAMCGGGVIDPSARPQGAAAAGLQDYGFPPMPDSFDSATFASSDPFYSSDYQAMFAVAPPATGAFRPAPAPYSSFAATTPDFSSFDEQFASSDPFGGGFPWGMPPGFPSAPSAMPAGPSPAGLPSGTGIGGQPAGSVVPIGPFPGGGVTCSATASGPNASATAIATSGPGGTTCQKSTGG